MTTSVLTSSGGKGTLRVVGDSDVDLERVRVAIAAFSASRARRCSRARFEEGGNSPNAIPSHHKVDRIFRPHVQVSLSKNVVDMAHIC